MFFRDFFRHKLTLVGCLVLITFAFLLIQKLFVFYGFQTSFNDFYNKSNATWNASLGNGLYIDLWGKSYFSNHFYPFYYLIALPYMIAPTDFWLLLFQVVCQTVMAWAILKIAFEYFGKRGAWITLGLLFANYTFRRFNIEPLFGESVMAPLIAWVMYFLIKKRDIPVLILSFLILFTKENAVVFLAMLGGFYIVFRRQYVIGLSLIGIGTIHVWYLIKVFIPSYNVDGYEFSRYVDYGGSSRILKMSDFWYVLGLLMPLGFLPLFSSYSVLGLGFVLQNILSVNQKLMVDLSYHVSQPLIPIFFISSILALDFLLKKGTHTQFLRFAKGCVALGVFLNILLFIFLDLRVFCVNRSTWDAHRLLRQIPAQASVSASRNYGAHLCHRKAFYRFPEYENADYVIVEKRDYFFTDGEPPNIRVQWAITHGEIGRLVLALLFETAPPSKKYFDALESLKKDPQYLLIDQGKGCFLFKRIALKKNSPV
jgi:uncharacterized membrane protein